MQHDNRVDLFVVGADFYAGATYNGRLEDGWCDFATLVEKEAHGYFDRKLGTTWYLTDHVPPDALRSFEEHKRQGMWLSRQGSGVARIIIDGAKYATRPPGVLSPGHEFRCKREEDAVRVLKQRADLAQDAMVISADGEVGSPLLSFLHEKYDGRLVTLVPPGLEIHDKGSVRIDRQHLEQARLKHDPRIPWNGYLESKERGMLVSIWYERARGEFDELIKGFVKSVPTAEVPSLRQAKVLSDLPIGDRVGKRVADILKTWKEDDGRLAQDRACIDFIARKLIADAADAILAERVQQSRDSAAEAGQPEPEGLHCDFQREYRRLPKEVQQKICEMVNILDPLLGRPNVDTLAGSDHKNMKELRFDAAGGVWRVAFAFDRDRRPILLAADNKSGQSEKQFYARLIEKADRRYNTHLANGRKR